MIGYEWIGILYAISSLLTVLFYVIALIFVIVKQSDRSKAKTLVVAGLATLILMQIGSFLFSFVAIRIVSAENVPFLLAAFGLFQSVIHAGAIGLLIAAALSPSETRPNDQATITGRIPTGNDNPYAAPSP